MRTNLILSLEIILKFEISQNNLEEYVAAAMHNIILKYLGNTSYNRQKKKKKILMVYPFVLTDLILEIQV